jgi:hypothetical protein
VVRGTKVFVPEAAVGQANAAEQQEKDGIVKMKNGLYANIHAKRERIEAGSKERMRKPGSKGAPTAEAFKQSAKTAKPVRGKKK